VDESTGIGKKLSSRWSARTARRTVLLAYAVLTALLVAYHEPWRDEADPWLLARDGSVLDVLRLASHVGHPCLWPLVQMPFAKAGFPYATQGVLNLVIVVAAMAVFFERAALPLSLKAAFAFGYHMSFGYAVVARNYGLGILLTFLVVALDRFRERRPLVYGALLAALANTSAHFFFVSGVFTALWILELRRRRVARDARLGWCVAALGLAIALAQLAPRTGGQFPPGVFTTFVPYRVLAPFRALMPVMEVSKTYSSEVPIALAPLAVIAWIGALLFLLSHARALLFLLGCALSLTYIFVFKYAGGEWHYGLFLIVLVSAHWLAEENGGLADDWRPSWLRFARLPESTARRLAHASLAASLFITALYSGQRSWRAEIARPYSGSQEMADFLTSRDLVDRPVAAYRAEAGAAVLAHLPKRFFYYPGIDDFGSYMLWDTSYSAGRHVPIDAAIARVKRRFPEWRQTGTLLLLNGELEDPERRGYRLAHRTAEPWRWKDERFFLYEPIPDVEASPGKRAPFQRE
jgi:hypothetical protein